MINFHDKIALDIALEMPYVPLLFVNQLAVLSTDDPSYRPLLTVNVSNTTRGSHAQALDLLVTASARVEGYSNTHTRGRDLSGVNAVGSGATARLSLAPIFSLHAFELIDELTPATVHTDVTIHSAAGEFPPIEWSRTDTLTLLPPATLFLGDPIRSNTHRPGAPNETPPSSPTAPGSSQWGPPNSWTPGPRFLASLVTPNAPEVQRVILQAAELHRNHRLVGALPNLSFDAIESQVEACFQAMQELKLRYVVPAFDVLPPVASGLEAAAAPDGARTFPRIRLPRDVIRDRLFECVGATLLIASVLEGVSLAPHIVSFVIRDGASTSSHTLLGFGVKAPTGEGRRVPQLLPEWFETHSPDGTAERDSLEHNPFEDDPNQKGWVLDFLEPSMATPGYSFQEARQRAYDYIESMKAPANAGKVTVHIIQIYKARRAGIYPLSTSALSARFTQSRGARS